MKWNIFWRAGKVTGRIWKQSRRSCAVEICAELSLSADQQYKTGGGTGGGRDIMYTAWQYRRLQRQQRREFFWHGHTENPLWM